MTAMGLAACVTALWWIVLGLITLARLQWIKIIFYPFAQSLSRGRIGGFIMILFLVLVVSAGIVWYYGAAPIFGSLSSA